VAPFPVHGGILLTGNQWPATDPAARVDAFFRLRWPVAGRLYRWGEGQGWTEVVPAPL
jgi:hypothetical protein